MLSDGRIKEIKRLRAGITPPPWTEDWHYVKAATGVICRSFIMDVLGPARPNVTFIAAAPTIVDDLLAEREELLGTLGRVREIVDKAETAVADMDSNWMFPGAPMGRHLVALLCAALVGKEGAS